MRAPVRVIVCAVVMLGGTAQPAHAIWRWLEHMSGPGWYNGFSIEKKVRCIYPTTLPMSEAHALAIVEKTTSTEMLRAFERSEEKGLKRTKVLEAIETKLRSQVHTESVGLTISFPCSSSSKIGNISEPRTHTFGLSGGLMWSTINRLQYEPSVSPEDTQVYVLTAGSFYDVRVPRVWKRLEVGASAEGYAFFGKTTRRMVRVALEPRATFTVARIREERSGNPTINLKVRVGALWVLPGFDRKDFGALPGERLGPELLTSVRLVVDIECWPWKRGACGVE